MRKIFSIVCLLLCGVCLFTACEDDNDSNPVIGTPTTFVLNTPAYANSAVDLASTDSLRFTWSQPDYGGFPLACEYQLQVSLTGNFTTEYDENAEDNTGADYITLDDYFTTCMGLVGAYDVNIAAEKLAGWQSEDDVPDTQTIYVRATCYVPGSSSLSSTETIYSNVINIQTAPYYEELTAADPEIWYLVGACIGDGSWNNSQAGIGTGLIPMQPVNGGEYDAKTGQGEIIWIGYLTPDGFKLIKTPGSWDDQWGQSDGAFVKNDGGSSNITVDESGYYKVTLDTKNDKLTIESYSAPTTYGAMCISGDFNSWSTETAMNPCNTYGGDNHDWYYDLDASDGDTTAKFLSDYSWNVNWGDTAFPYGWGVSNGANIPVTQGSYRIIFNDITGYYTFISL